MPAAKPEQATVEVKDAPPEPETTTNDNGFEAESEEAPEFVKSVKYTGLASKRVITKEEFASLGSGSETAVWGLLNDFLVPYENFDAEALKYLKADGRFTVIG